MFSPVSDGHDICFERGMRAQVAQRTAAHVESLVQQLQQAKEQNEDTVIMM